MDNENNLGQNQNNPNQTNNWLENSEKGGAPIPEFMGAKSNERQNPYVNMPYEELSKTEEDYINSLNEIVDGTMRGLEDHLNEPMYRNELDKIRAEKEDEQKGAERTRKEKARHMGYLPGNAQDRKQKTV